MRYTPSSYVRFILEKHLQDFLNETLGVLKGKDLEYLHRMRVSSRRLRTALWMFKQTFSLKEYKYFQIQFRRVTRALGKARDLDTHIDFLQKLRIKAKNKSSVDALNRMIQLSWVKRLNQQKSVKIVLQNIDKNRVVPKLTFILNKTLPPIELNKIVSQKINKCLNEMFIYRSIVHQYKKQDELHQLRIAAKHLRYTLENANKLYHRKLTPHIKQAQLIQRHLGDMRNQLIWKAEFMKMKSCVHDQKLLVKLIKQCEQSALKSYKKFIQVWNDKEQLRTWKNLKNIIHES